VCFFVIIKNCFVVAASYPFFVGMIRSGVTHFFRAWGNTTDFLKMSKKKPWLWLWNDSVEIRIPCDTGYVFPGISCVGSAALVEVCTVVRALLA